MNRSDPSMLTAFGWPFVPGREPPSRTGSLGWLACLWLRLRGRSTLCDLKCDGRHVGTKSICQCYAPYLVEDFELIAKVNEDFHGTRSY
jgi:hypothetical protein